MKNRKLFWFKVSTTIVFTCAILAMYLYAIIAGDLPHNELSYTCIGLSFILSLIFIHKSSKKILITIALGFNVIADYFLVLMLNDSNMIYGVSIFLVAQFFYMIHTILLTKKMWLKVINIASRVIVCLVLCLTLTPVLGLGVLENLALIYITNFFISLLFLLTKIKTEWLTFIGFLLFIICDIFVGLYFGGEFLNLPHSFLKFLYLQDWAFIFYIPGNFLISISSVWEFKSNKHSRVKQQESSF